MKKYSGTRETHAMVEHECSKCGDTVRAPKDVGVVTCGRCTVLSTGTEALPAKPLTPEEKEAAKAVRLQALNDARKARKAERDAVKKGNAS